VRDIQDIINKARERAIMDIARELSCYGNGFNADPLMIESIRHRIEINELHLSEEKPAYDRLGWYENHRAAYLDSRVIHSMRVLHDEQVTHTKSEESIPRDPLSHFLLWIGDRCRYERIRVWLRSKAKTRTIHLSTTRTVKLFLPPWPMKHTDQPYLDWVSSVRSKSNQATAPADKPRPQD
jgi:hypothetical protein